MKHLLVIGYLWPEPKSSAAGSRMMQLLELFLDKNWKITYASAAKNSQYAVTLENLGVEKVSIQPNDESVNTWLAQLDPDAVLFDRFMMEEQYGWRVAENCPNALRILDTEDLHFFRKARSLALKAKRDLSKADLFSDEAKREIASILRCDLSLIISEAEMDLLLKTFKIDENLLFYLPFLLDEIPPEQQENLPEFSQRKDFLFIGNFLHEPNWDAVRFLKESVWPKIRKDLPGVKLHIYGAYAKKKVKQLHNEPEGFLVHGRADDALEVMQSARLLLAPLRFGAGLKGKFVEAMTVGTPSITTMIGAEGIGGSLPWSGEIANTADELAQAAIQLYTREKRWLTARKNGFAIIKNRFQKNEFEPIFMQQVEHLLKRLPAHRERNFMGSLLQHHTLQSTKYMARWIEEKNKK